METKRITLTPEQIAKMDREEFSRLILRATKIEATCVVRRADGSIRYDKPELAGTYHEDNLPLDTKRYEEDLR